MHTQFNLPYLNYNHIVKNINSMYQFIEEEFNLSLEAQNLKEKYFKSINHIQNVKVPYEIEEIKISFYDEYLQNGLLQLGMIDSEDLKGNRHVHNEEERVSIQNNINDALSLIDELHPDLSDLIHNLVGTFLILKKDGFGGGSVSNIMGLIWLNPQEEWEVTDYAEAIYHEFIHQSIFLDDMVNSMFPDPDACSTEEGLVTSTILKRKRPLDRAYHAACVSIGIMHLYYLLDNGQKSTQYMDDLKITVNEINRKKEFLGEQGILTLKEINKFINTPNFDSVTSTLSA